MNGNVITWNLPTETLKPLKPKRIFKEELKVDTVISETVLKDDVKPDSSSFSTKEVIETHVVENNLKEAPIEWKVPEPIKKSEYIEIDFVREPMVTFSITPNNAPMTRVRNERGKRSNLYDEYTLDNTPFTRNPMNSKYNQTDSNNMILNTIHGLYQKFYLPKRIRFHKNGVKLKMNDIVSFKIVIDQQMLKFYMTVPKRWSRNFLSSIRHEWGEVDIVQVEDSVLNFDIKKIKVMEVDLNFHYGLSIKPSGREDSFMQSIASLASTLDKDEKLLIDFNIEPVGDKWKENANKKISKYKRGKAPTKDNDYSLMGLIMKVWDVVMIVADEGKKMLDEFLNLDAYDKDNKTNTKEEETKNLRLQYSQDKAFPTTKGYNVQTRVIGQSDNQSKLNHMMKNVQNSFDLLEGDNYFTYTNVRSKKKKAKILEAVEQNKPTLFKPQNILVEKELKNFIKLPSKETLQDYKKVINQDNFTRTEIDESLLDNSNGAIPFARTLDKEPKLLHIPSYEREDWTEKGRLAKNTSALDTRMIPTLMFGKQGSGKTTAAMNQILYTFGANIKDKEQWKKESKSVVAFDVADGDLIRTIYNHLPEWQRERVIVLNHANFNHPIAVNNSDLEEFNREVMNDEDYAYVLAEMESKLMLEIIESEGKTIAMDRWFSSALQAVHIIDKDYGYIEAMRVITDAHFRQLEVIPKLRETKNKRLLRDIETYHNLASKGKTDRIIETIQNRFSELERDQKLWDCIAQRPVRDENGKVTLNFRKMMDGDENGAYLILIHIPKTGISKTHRRFLFAHYFTKIWNVLLSREAGFAGREYRPETLIVVDEIHQIINIPLIGKLFIDLFKEPRKYSGRYIFTLHGWSSLAVAGRGLENDIKQSILDNMCNLFMLSGGEDAFESLKNFLEPMRTEDFLNLSNMQNCGIFSIRANNKNHVFQAKMITAPHMKGSDFKTYSKLDSNFITTYQSPYGRPKDIVRDDNLERGDSMFKSMIESELSTKISTQEGEEEWEEIEKAGMRD